jgi:hypothetical protein
MKKFPILLACMMLISQAYTQAIRVSGSTGADGYYLNLKGAFMQINSNDQSGRSIFISVMTDSDEGTTPSVLYQGNWDVLEISPDIITPGIKQIFGTVHGAPLLDLNGADRVKIRGGGLQDPYGLTIVNYSTSSMANTSTIRFINDAQDNLVENCRILGCATTPLNVDGGTVFFSVGNYCFIDPCFNTGNDRDTIVNNIIASTGMSLPSKGIYAKGINDTYVLNNSEIYIKNNRIFDFHINTGTAGIYVKEGNTSWIIEDNYIYQNLPRNVNGEVYGIYFKNELHGDNTKIRSNTIGKNFDMTGSFVYSGVVQMHLIYSHYKDTSPFLPCFIENNTILDISITALSPIGSHFFGINNKTLAGGGNRIEINDNAIKNVFTYDVTGIHAGINLGSANQLFGSRNVINNLEQNGFINPSGSMFGILIEDPDTVSIEQNEINSLINNKQLNEMQMWGISSPANAKVVHIAKNIISNFYSDSPMPHFMGGIYENGANYQKHISGDSISAFVSNGGGASFKGIQVSQGVSLIENVVVSGFSNAANSNPLEFHNGIIVSGGKNHHVSSSKVQDISSMGVNARVWGIHVAGADTTILSNNMISELTAPMASGDVVLSGMRVSGGQAIYGLFNTIYLNAHSQATTFGTAGVFADISPVLDLRNNNIVNSSSNKGTGYTVAYHRNGTDLSTYASASNNNNFNTGIFATLNSFLYYDGVTGDHGVIAYRSRVSPRDNSSFTEFPPFMNISVSPFDLRISSTIPSRLESGGVAISSPITINKDIDEDLRHGAPGYTGTGTAPDVGADEFDGIRLPFDEADILAFSIPYQYGNAVIDKTNAIITVPIFTMEYMYVTVPTIEISPKASITPDPTLGIQNVPPQDYEIFTVTAEDGITVRPWTIQFVEINHNLSITNNNGYSVDMSWDALGCDNYIVYYRSVGSSSWNFRYVSTNSFRLSRLFQDTDYEWFVLYYEGTTLRGKSQIAQFSTPMLISVTRDIGTTMLFEWDSITYADNYIVHYRELGDVAWRIGATSSTHRQVWNITPNSTYQYRLLMFDGASYIGATPIYSHKTNIVNSNIIANNGNSAIIAWDSVAGANYYILQYRILSFFEIPWRHGGSTTNSRQIWSLLPNTTYEYRILVYFPDGYFGVTQTETFQTASLKNLKIDENSNEDGFTINVYPNPAQAYCNVDVFSDSETAMRWSLLDVTGKTILSGKEDMTAGISSFTINIQDIAEGMYFLKFFMNDNLQTVKVIKN